MQISGKWIHLGRRLVLMLLEAVFLIVVLRIGLSFMQDKGELLVGSLRWLFR